jgi:hypothetical protein
MSKFTHSELAKRQTVAPSDPEPSDFKKILMAHPWTFGPMRFLNWL